MKNDRQIKLAEIILGALVTCLLILFDRGRHPLIQDDRTGIRCRS